MESVKGFHITVVEAYFHHNYRVQTVKYGRGASESHEGIHIRVAAEEFAVAAGKVAEIKDDNRNKQNELGYGEGDSVFHSADEGGNGESYHRAHRNVHKE